MCICMPLYWQARPLHLSLCRGVGRCGLPEAVTWLPEAAGLASTAALLFSCCVCSAGASSASRAFRLPSLQAGCWGLRQGDGWLLT